MTSLTSFIDFSKNSVSLCVRFLRYGQRTFFSKFKIKITNTIKNTKAHKLYGTFQCCINYLLIWSYYKIKNTILHLFFEYRTPIFSNFLDM